MKLNHVVTLIAGLTLTAPLLSAAPGGADRNAKSSTSTKKSTAEREISNAEYALKNLRRRFSRDSWKKSALTRKSARKNIASVRARFAEVAKKDPRWNISKQLAEITKFERMVDTAEKASGTSSKPAAKGTSSADTMDVKTHPAAMEIRMARMFMKSLRKKIAARKFQKDDRLRRDMADDFRKLETKYFVKILGKDAKFPIAAWKSELAKFKKAVNAANKKAADRHKAVYNQLALRTEYDQIVDQNILLDLLYAASKGKYKTGRYEWMRQKVDDLGKFSRDFAKKCASRKYESIPQSKFDRERRFPKVTCGLARNYKKLALKFVDANAKDEVKKLIGKQKKAISALKKSGAITPNNYSSLANPEKTVNRYFEKYDKYYRQFSGRAKRSTFTPLANQQAAFRSALKVAAKRSAFPKDARYFEASLKPAATRKIKGAEILKARAINSAWKIKKNGLGVPLSKEKWAFIMTKSKGDAFCRVNQGEVKAQYKGGGRYTKPVWKYHNNHFFVSACR